jgi:LAO/AO transport system kinase
MTAAPLAERVAAGDRRALARAITLVESTRTDHRADARALLDELLPRTGSSVRVGISGAPGAGKSTLIEAMGLHAIEQGHQVAVLAVDPSSSRSGGSILGDKTRMSELGRRPEAFIRPSPSGGTLGGVARRTREALLVCEAAGFDVVMVETVGVGQSEVAVADLVDLFVLVAAPGGGDELQGIKRGIMELADLIVVNKADGDNIKRAESAAADYKNALQIFTPHGATWFPPVLTVSGRENRGLKELWDKVLEHRRLMTSTGEFAARRQSQAVSWMRDMLEDRLMGALKANPKVAAELPRIEASVRDGTLLATIAVDRIMQMMRL